MIIFLKSYRLNTIFKDKCLTCGWNEVFRLYIQSLYFGTIRSAM